VQKSCILLHGRFSMVGYPVNSEHSALPTLKFRLLRAPEIYQNGAPAVGPSSAKARALLYYLAMSGRAYTRPALATLLWGDHSEQAARSNLRKVLRELEAALPGHLIIDRHSVVFDTNQPYWVDALEFTSRINLDAVDAASEISALQQAITLYEGDFLEGFSVLRAPDFEAWMLAERARLRQLLSQALSRLAESYAGQGDLAQAITYARRLLVLEPWREEGHRQIIRWLAESGQRSAALAQYELCRQALAAELGVEPALATRDLYEALLQDEGSLNNGQPRQITTPEYRLIGRQSQWQILDSIWQKVLKGASHFICVAGEPGIGKTRLVEELLIHAQRQGHLTARARAYAMEGRLAYGPVADWLRSEPLQRHLAKLQSFWLGEISRILPELLIEQPALPAPQPLTERWQQKRFFEALVHAFTSAQRPILLLLDDLQWCDAESLEWIHYLLRSASRTGLLLVGTVRNEEVDEDHPLRGLSRQLTQAEQLTTVLLPRLSEEESAELAMQVAKRPLEPIAASRLYQETEGNALFVIETIRASDEEKAEESHPAPALRNGERSTHNYHMPPKIFAVIQERLARLSAEARNLAHLAAAVGREFRVELLAHAAGGDEAKITQALEELWQRGIVREQAHSYDFSHDKIREVAYAEIKPMRRGLLHRNIGRALEHLNAHQLPEIAGELAVHFDVGGLTEKARQFYQLAGEQALANYANGSALAYFDQALALMPETEKLARFHLLSLRRSIYRRQAARDAEAHDLALMQHIADSLDDTRVALRCQAQVAAYYADNGASVGDYIKAMEFSKRAVTLARMGGALDVEADAFHRWGFVCWAQAEYASARDLLLQSLALAKQGGFRAIQAECLGNISSCGLFAGLDLYAQTMAYLDEALALFQEIGDPDGEALTLNRMGYTILAQAEGNYEQAESYHQRALNISQSIRHPVQESVTQANLGLLYNCLGDYTRSLAALRQALTLTESTGDRRQQGATLDYLGYAYLNQGDFANARHFLEAAYNLLHPLGVRVWEVKALSDLGLLHHCQGEHERGLAYQDQALATVRTYGDVRQKARILTRRGHVLMALKQLDEAEVSYRQALASYQKMEQKNRSMEALAGLAQVARATQKDAEARAIVETILAHLQEHILDRTEDALRVYLSCYEVLCDHKDARMQAVLEVAHTQLQARAATVGSEEARKLFWCAPSHRSVLDGMQ
jgi:DNA-binding SARP family transcriptional activator